MKFGKCELIFGIARLILESLSYLAVIQFATLEIPRDILEERTLKTKHKLST